MLLFCLHPYPNYCLLNHTPSHLPKSSPTSPHFYINWVPPTIMYARYCPENLCHPTPLNIDHSPRSVDCCVVLIWCPWTSSDEIYYIFQSIPVFPSNLQHNPCCRDFERLLVYFQLRMLLHFQLRLFLCVQITTLVLIRVRLINITGNRLRQ